VSIDLDEPDLATVVAHVQALMKRRADGDGVNLDLDFVAKTVTKKREEGVVVILDLDEPDLVAAWPGLGLGLGLWYTPCEGNLATSRP